MFEGLSQVETRIAGIEQRLAALEARTAPGGGSFSQVLADAAGKTNGNTLPPVTVSTASAAAPAEEYSPLPQPPHWQIGGLNSPGEGEEAVRRAARRYGVDPSLAAAVARAESGFDPHATSGAGARGLMQLMPDTARALGVRDPFDPEQNADAGVRYLAEQLQRFGDTKRALAAYNAGPNRVARYGDVPPIPETRNYVQRVLEYQRQYRADGLR